MKRAHFFLLAVLTLATALIATAQTAKSEPGIDEASAKLDTLLRQRRETLGQLVKVTTEHYRTGRTTIDSVIRASRQLLNAELELAEDRNARLAIHAKRIALLKDFERIVQTQFKAGDATQEDILAARAARLEAEIQLLREQPGK